MLKLNNLNNRCELQNRELHMIKGGDLVGGEVETLECHGVCSCSCVNSPCTCENKNASNKRKDNR